MAVKGVIIDDACVIEVGSCPQAVCADGDFGYRHKVLSDECQGTCRGCHHHHHQVQTPISSWRDLHEWSP